MNEYVALLRPNAGGPDVTITFCAPDYPGAREAARETAESLDYHVVAVYLNDGRF